MGGMNFGTGTEHKDSIHAKAMIVSKDNFVCAERQGHDHLFPSIVQKNVFSGSASWNAISFH